MPKLKFRYENFGGIISSDDPPFLAFADRDFIRNIETGADSDLWTGSDEIGVLSAPTEVHFAITNKCSVKCTHCYMGSGTAMKDEFDTGKMKKAIDVLSEMKIFHMAMGGGEAIERPDLFELAEYAREKGIVPNLTVSGRGITKKLASKMKVFGQVNISVDGIYSNYSKTRDKMSFVEVEKAIYNLLSFNIPTGINCVLTKVNYDQIEELFMYASRHKLNEIEFLRFKPSGRASRSFEDLRMTFDQNIKLIPELSKFSEKYKITAKIDCSFVPMLCYHNPPVELLNSFATFGCEAGNVLLGIKPDGKVSGCSFLEPEDLDVFELPEKFKNSFREERIIENNLGEPCRSCSYLKICKGGCRAVSLHVTGNSYEPDPYCPTVEIFKKNL